MSDMRLSQRANIQSPMAAHATSNNLQMVGRQERIARNNVQHVKCFKEFQIKEKYLILFILLLNDLIFHLFILLLERECSTRNIPCGGAALETSF